MNAAHGGKPAVMSNQIAVGLSESCPKKAFEEEWLDS
jgi:hypothetical protein